MRYKVFSNFYLGRVSEKTLYRAGEQFPADFLSDKNREFLLTENNPTKQPLIEEVEDNYSEMTVAELKNVLTDRGIEFSQKAKKDELLKLVER